VRSDAYDGEEFMKWEDIEVKLVGSTQEINSKNYYLTTAASLQRQQL
jgi:hypothetical protein